jgi:hypothetical protein
MHEEEDCAVGRVMLAAHVFTAQHNASGLGAFSLTFYSLSQSSGAMKWQKYETRMHTEL